MTIGVSLNGGTNLMKLTSQNLREQSQTRLPVIPTALQKKDHRFPLVFKTWLPHTRLRGDRRHLTVSGRQPPEIGRRSPSVNIAAERIAPLRAVPLDDGRRIGILRGNDGTEIVLCLTWNSIFVARGSTVSRNFTQVIFTLGVRSSLLGFAVLVGTPAKTTPSWSAGAGAFQSVSISSSRANRRWILPGSGRP